VRTYLEKICHRKGLVEWLKVKALSSNPSPQKGKEKKKGPVILTPGTVM
jgi:hypothetical protein